MPIFDYQCNGCGKLYDVFHKTKELVEDIVCPSCGATSYKKLMSAPTVFPRYRAFLTNRAYGMA